MIFFFVVFSLAIAPYRAANAASFCDGEKWDIVFRDEFDGTQLDNTTWTPDLGAGDSRVRGSQGTLDNVYLEDGALVLRTKRERSGEYNFTSGAVESRGKRSFQGLTRVCVNAMLPSGGEGLWPAHWLMPDNDACWPSNGEIDIMEMVNSDGVTHGTYHWKVNGCNDPHSQISSQTNVGEDWFETFHEFAVEYSARHVAFALDDVVFKNITIGSSEHPVFYDVPYYIILNTAIDGPWPAPATNNTKLPAYHRIDYVRVSQPHSF